MNFKIDDLIDEFKSGKNSIMLAELFDVSRGTIDKYLMKHMSYVEYNKQLEKNKFIKYKKTYELQQTEIKRFANELGCKILKDYMEYNLHDLGKKYKKHHLFMRDVIIYLIGKDNYDKLKSKKTGLVSVKKWEKKRKNNTAIKHHINVEKILNEFIKGVKIEDIAKPYGVHYSTIRLRLIGKIGKAAYEKQVKLNKKNRG